MTTTVTLDNMPSTTPSDVAVYFLDQTKLVLKSQVTSDGGNKIASVYSYADGSLAVDTLVTVNHARNLKTGVVNTSIRLATSQTVQVDDLPAEITPIEVVVAWNYTGAVLDAAALLRMIGTAYSLAFNGVTSKVPNGGVMGALARGLTHDLY